MATSDEMKTFLDEWATHLLTERADKTWTPGLYAGPDTAAELGSLGGLPVNADHSLSENRLVIRCEANCPIDRMTGTQMPVGSEMAAYNGIHR